MPQGERAVVVCVGESGRGKTHTLRLLARQAPRLLIADATGDFAPDAEQTFTMAGACSAAVDARSFVVRSGPEAGQRRLLPFRYRLWADLDGAPLAAYTTGHSADVAMLGERASLIALNARDCVLVLDELKLWCTPARITPVMALLMSVGRHPGVSVLATTRRPSEVHRLFTSQADLLIAFQTVEPLDLDYLRGRFGPATDRLARLPPRRALAVGDATCLRLLGLSALPSYVELVRP